MPPISKTRTGALLLPTCAKPLREPAATMSRSRMGKPLRESVPEGSTALCWQLATVMRGMRLDRCWHQSLVALVVDATGRGAAVAVAPADTASARIVIVGK